ncbi:MAG: phenylalanine--tRNA ligase subunit beta [Bacteroidota bacterium]|nr:phenylalanine--tRNA ligase subunit beta [Bacteroidota bacterium]
MKISHKWLRQYVEFNITPEELADKLTKAGLEVESIDYLGSKFNNFFTGLVLTVTKHPNANKLTVCEVNIGSSNIAIVCGAPNIAVGQKVVVGLAGAVVPRNQHDPEGKPFELAKVRIRGIESNGMICSEYELGIGEDKDGIMVLNDNATIGIPLSEFLGLNDVVFEIGITPNRPDCLSHIGIAREVAAALKTNYKIPEATIIESSSSIENSAKVVVEDSDKCPRYSARVIKNIKVQPSPKWLQDYLSAIGIRPINNVVDATNYVLMETGHPLHAFDYDKLDEKTIIVREAIDGEHFVTLDGKGRSLTSGMLLICDASKPIAIAGVMGGVNSEISDTTQNILLESAYFDPRCIRKTSKQLSLISDASQRFERGTDPNATIYSINRAARLIAEIAGGEILKGIIDVYPKAFSPIIINLSLQRTNNILGTILTNTQIIDFLESIDCEYQAAEKTNNSEDIFVFQVPSFRPDLEKEIDLIEELARLYGYDNIETKMQAVIKFTSNPVQSDIVDEMRLWLVGRGFNEIITNSLQNKELAYLSSSEVVEVMNPISKDMSAMRTSLIPNILEVVCNNIYHQTKNLNLFEVGKTYLKIIQESENQKSDENYKEEEKIILAKSGIANFPNWAENERFSDIFDLKGEVEDLLLMFGLDKYKFIPYSTTKALVEMTVSIEINQIEVGYIAKVQKQMLKQFDIEQDVYIADLNINILKSLSKIEKKYKPLPDYPMVLRDLAFISDKVVPVAEMQATIYKAGGELLKKVEIFDLYSGDQIHSDKKSSAFTLQFLSEDRTLTDVEIEKIINKIVEAMKVAHNAALRK